MEDSIADQIQKRIEELPLDVQTAIASSDFDKKVQMIGQRHALHIDQMETLGDETMLVMLGYTDPDMFVNNLMSQLRISKEQAAKVTADINTEILVSIRESLKSPAAPASKPSMPSPVTPSAPAPQAEAPVSHPAEMMLSQKTVTVPPPAPHTPALPPQKPTNYKTDPYREPPLP